MSISAPTDIANCTLYLKKGTSIFSDLGSTPVVDGDLVEQWNDQSGTGNHAIQTTSANRPKWNATDSAVEVEQQDTNRQWLKVSGLNINSQAFSFFVIMKGLNNLRRTGDAVTTPDAHSFFEQDAGSGPNFHYLWDTAEFGQSSSNQGVLSLYDGADFNAFGSVKVPTQSSLLGVAGGAASTKFIVNNNIETVAVAASVTSTGIRISAGDFALQGGILEVFAYSRQLTVGEITDIQAYAATLGAIDSANTRLILMGDSIMTGKKCTTNRTFVRQAFGGLNVEQYCTSEPSITLQTLAANAAAVEGSLVSASKTNIVFCFAGTNDIALAGRTAAQVMADMRTTAQALIAAYAGTIFVPVTMLSRGDVGGIESIRTSFNALLLAGAPEWTTVVDVGGTTQMGGATSYNDTTYFDADKTHPNAGGHTFMAPYFLAAYRAVLPARRFLLGRH